MKRSLLIVLILSLLPFIGNTQIITKIDKIAPFQEGFAGVKKGDSWGFIDANGALVINYRKDIAIPSDGNPVFSNGLCLIHEVKDGISYYGYINIKGEMVIPAEYLVATPFENGFARVIKHYKSDTGGTNILGKNIVKYSYNELVIDTNNKTVQHLLGPNNLVYEKLASDRNVLPEISSAFIGDNLVAVREKDNSYTIYKLKK